MRDVVAVAVVNANTVLKAYRDLEREGLVEARSGQVSLDTEGGHGLGVSRR